MTNDASLERDNDIFYWVYPFTTYITFLEGDGYHRNKLESDITLNDNNNNKIELKNMGQDKISGILTFQTDRKYINDDNLIMRGDVIKHAESNIFKKFEHSLNLLGYNLSETTFEKIKCLNANGRHYLVKNYSASAVRILGKTQTITNEKFKNINTLFNATNFNILVKLNDVDIDLTQNEQFQDFFIKYWIKFNSIYNIKSVPNNDKQILLSFIHKLNKTEFSILYNRNKKLIYLLSESNICNKNDKLSKQLKLALNGDESKIIEYTMLCVYQCRNELFHSGNSNFKNFKELCSFLFDVIYLEQFYLQSYNELQCYAFH